MIYATRRVFCFPSSSPVPWCPSLSNSTDRHLKGLREHPGAPPTAMAREWHLVGHLGPAVPLQAATQQFPCWLMTCHFLAMSSDIWGQNAALAGYSDLGREFWLLSVPFLSIPFLPESPPVSPGAAFIVPQAPVTPLTPHGPHSLPCTHLLSPSPAATMAEFSILNDRQGQELLLDRPSILKSSENLQGPFGAGLCQGRAPRHRGTPPVLHGTALT